MKKFRKFLLVLLLIPCCFLFNACMGKTYVTGIEKVAENEASVTYQVNYSDGTSTNFIVENGKDGQDGTSIEEIFASCVEKGMYENSKEGFSEFLKDYLVIENPTTDIKSATNKALCSAVSVYSKFTVRSGYYNQKENLLATGAGVIYSTDQTNNIAYIVTNYHVVYEVTSIESSKIANEIYLYQYGADISIKKDDNKKDSNNAAPLITFGGDAIKATYIGGSMNYDIAVLKVNLSTLLAVNENARAVDLADGYGVTDTAIAIGNPEGSGISVTKGIVNVDSEHIEMTAVDKISTVNFRVMRVDAAINGGNSGGGLFNDKGELIGIVNAKIESSEIDNMGYALPVDNITKVANNIIDNFKNENKAVGVKKIILGITTMGTNSKFEYDPITGSGKLTEETMIYKVNEGSIAEQKQLQAGDIITAVAIGSTENKIELTRSFQLGEILLNVREGDEVYLYYTRGDIKNNMVLFSATANTFQTIA